MPAPAKKDTRTSDQVEADLERELMEDQARAEAAAGRGSPAAADFPQLAQDNLDRANALVVNANVALSARNVSAASALAMENQDLRESLAQMRKELSALSSSLRQTQTEQVLPPWRDPKNDLCYRLHQMDEIARANFVRQQHAFAVAGLPFERCWD